MAHGITRRKESFGRNPSSWRLGDVGDAGPGSSHDSGRYHVAGFPRETSVGTMDDPSPHDPQDDQLDTGETTASAAAASTLVIYPAAGSDSRFR